MLKQLWPACLVFVFLMIITGVIYPLLMTGVGQLFFSHRVNGSLIVQEGQVVGSEYLGQTFSSPRYFWGRPSATTDFPGNTLASGGSNLGPTNPDLIKAIRARVEKLRQADPEHGGVIPIDLVTASGSGLDPHISPRAADYQVSRVARARGLSEDTVARLVTENTQGRQWLFLGEPRVNVLTLNLALDQLSKGAANANNSRRQAPQS